MGAVQVAIVIVAIIVGAFCLKPANLSPYFPYGFGGAITGAATVFFAVFGCDAMSTAAEESKDAQRNLPKAIIYSLAISMVLYLLACTVLTGIQHYDRIDKKCGFATAFTSIGLDRFADVVAIGAIVGILTVLFSFMLGASRIWYAISRDGLLPSWFAQTNRSHVPHRPTWIVGVLSAAIAGLVPIGTAAELTNIGILVAFIVVSAAVIVLCYRSPELDRTFRTPAMPLTPILGIGFSVWLISKLPAATWWRFVIWFLLGIVVYGFYGYRQSRLARGRGHHQRRAVGVTGPVRIAPVRPTASPATGYRPARPSRTSKRSLTT